MLHSSTRLNLLTAFMLMHYVACELIALLYVGPFKTGSTWVQEALLVKFRKQLEQQNFYSVTNRTDEMNESKRDYDFGACFNEFRKRPMCKPLIQSYIDGLSFHLSEQHNIIIASEALSKLPVNPQNLFSLLQGFRPRLCVVHRDFINTVASLENQMAKTEHQVRDSLHFLSSRQQVFGYMSFLSAHSILEGYAPFVAREDIWVIDYEGAQTAGVDIVEATVQAALPEVQLPLTSLLANRTLSNRHSDIRVHDLFHTVMVLYQLPRERREAERVEHCCKSHFSRGHWLDLTPMKCVGNESLEELKNLSVYLDNALRQTWSDRMVCGNEEANLRKIRSVEASPEHLLCFPDQQALWHEPRVLFPAKEVMEECLGIPTEQRSSFLLHNQQQNVSSLSEHNVSSVENS